MIRSAVLIIALIILAMILALPGCEKEKIVESTEYVHDIEYVQLPADTVYRVDTVNISDPVELQGTDTVIVTDTVLLGADTIIVTDTVIQTDYIYDTTMVYDTTMILDTVEIEVNRYDTVVVTDTIETLRCNPNEYFAFTALQYYCNQTVIDAIYQQFGLNDGWVLYLNTFQLDLNPRTSDVYDIYGYIDYWTPDWSGFYAFEFYWRMVYTGGDPADVNNWEMTLPPATTATSIQPGVKLTPDNSPARRTLR